MRKRRLIGAAAVLLAVGGVGAHAAPPVGTDTTVVPANSDRVVTIPFNREAVGEFETSGVSGSTVSLEGDPGFNGDALADTHYVRVIDGPGAGLWSTISGNQSASVTLSRSAVASELSGAGGDTVRVYPHHTIDSVFKRNLRGVSHTAGTSVLLFDNSAGVQNLPPGGAGAVNFIESPATGDLIWNGVDGEDTVLPPNTAFVIRNNSDEPLTFVAQGFVPDHPVSFLLPGGATRDIAIGTGYPVNTQTIGRTNFGGVVGRSILLYDNTLNVQNLPPGGAGSVNRITSPVSGEPIWNGVDGADTTLPSAEGFLLRQNGEAGGLVRTTPAYPVATD